MHRRANSEYRWIFKNKYSRALEKKDTQGPVAQNLTKLLANVTLKFLSSNMAKMYLNVINKLKLTKL